MPSGPRVVVAMSGGVDSSAAAGLLCEQGYDVVGVTLKLYNASGTEASLGGRCCSPRDIEDARATAAKLGFPHYVVDEVDAFQAGVIDDFVAEYQRGRTPNPCVRCNERLKFGPLLRFARAVGAEALATGHYARLDRRADGQLRLRRAVDRDKDQAYFLFAVRTEVLEGVRFPLGALPKDEVRALARRLGLPNADKPDSQQLCFIPGGDHMAFLEERGGAGPKGVIVDETGDVLGEHGGTHRFTIGQRKGLPPKDGARRFVVKIDPATGTVYTAPREQLGRREIRIEDVRWLGPAPVEPFSCRVQIRHHAAAHPALVRVAGTHATAIFDPVVEGAAPGQAAVFFGDDEQVLGGGWIASPPVGTAAASELRSAP